MKFRGSNLSYFRKNFEKLKICKLLKNSVQGIGFFLKSKGISHCVGKTSMSIPEYVKKGFKDLELQNVDTGL